MTHYCCMCRRRQTDPKRYVLLELTADEKRVLKDSGLDPVNDLVYCKPCYNVATNRQWGAMFLKGMAERALRQAGVVDAEARAQKFHDKLLAKTKP